MIKVETETERTVRLSMHENEAALLYGAMESAIITRLNGAQRALFESVREQLYKVVA